MSLTHPDAAQEVSHVILCRHDILGQVHCVCGTRLVGDNESINQGRTKNLGSILHICEIIDSGFVT